MSKKNIIYSFVLISNIVWANTSFAGTDIINSLLLKVDNTLNKISAQYEQITLKVKEITNNKWLSFAEDATVKAKQAIEKKESIEEYIQKLTSAQSFADLMNLEDMQFFNNMSSRMAEIDEQSQRILENLGLAKDKKDPETDNSSQASASEDATSDSRNSVLSPIRQNSSRGSLSSNTRNGSTNSRTDNDNDNGLSPSIADNPKEDQDGKGSYETSDASNPLDSKANKSSASTTKSKSSGGSGSKNVSSRKSFSSSLKEPEVQENSTDVSSDEKETTSEKESLLSEDVDLPSSSSGLKETKSEEGAKSGNDKSENKAKSDSLFSKLRRKFTTEKKE